MLGNRQIIIDKNVETQKDKLGSTAEICNLNWIVNSIPIVISHLIAIDLTPKIISLSLRQNINPSLEPTFLIDFCLKIC